MTPANAGGAAGATFPTSLGTIPDEAYLYAIGPDGRLSGPSGTGGSPCLAAEIARRWNAHASLLAALEEVLTTWDKPNPMKASTSRMDAAEQAHINARSALAQARGGA